MVMNSPPRPHHHHTKGQERKIARLIYSLLFSDLRIALFLRKESFSFSLKIISVLLVAIKNLNLARPLLSIPSVLIELHVV